MRIPLPAALALIAAAAAFGPAPADARARAASSAAAPTPSLLPALASAAARAGQWERAAGLWRQVTIDTPADGRAWAALGEALIAIDEPAAARAALERAAGLIGSDAPGLAYHQGRASLRLGDGREAAAHFERAAVAAPGDPRVWTGLGVAQDLAGDRAAARAAYDRALALDPLHAAALHNRARSAALSAASGPADPPGRP